MASDAVQRVRLDEPPRPEGRSDEPPRLHGEAPGASGRAPGRPASQSPARLQIVAWRDPVVDERGVDPRSRYTEKFWLGILGPSATWLMRHLADGFDRSPAGFELDLDETARCLGLGSSDHPGSPFRRAFGRCVRFGMARPLGPAQLAVRRRLALVPARHLARLPAPVRDAHVEWAPMVGERAADRLSHGDRGGPATGSAGDRSDPLLNACAGQLIREGLDFAAIERVLGCLAPGPVVQTATAWSWARRAVPPQSAAAPAHR